MNYTVNNASALQSKLENIGYIVDPTTAMACWLAFQLERPLLVEGPSGVGKTELARSMALALDRPMIRLQCYEGLDESHALYEWDYSKQILYTQLLRDVITKEAPTNLDQAIDLISGSEASFFSSKFLIARPLLQSLTSDQPCVLLIDEVDRADPEFEAFLLEFLSEMQVTLPELGTIRAKHIPLVILTTNATRDMTDALRRRCFHAYMEFPSPQREVQIIQARIPQIEKTLAQQITHLAQMLRSSDLQKPPSISETIDYARAVILLGKHVLDPDFVEETLGILLKHQSDRIQIETSISKIMTQVADLTREIPTTS